MAVGGGGKKFFVSKFDVEILKFFVKFCFFLLQKLHDFRVGRFLSPKNAIDHFYLSKNNSQTSTFCFVRLYGKLGPTFTRWFLRQTYTGGDHLHLQNGFFIYLRSNYDHRNSVRILHFSERSSTTTL